MTIYQVLVTHDNHQSTFSLPATLDQMLSYISEHNTGYPSLKQRLVSEQLMLEAVNIRRVGYSLLQNPPTVEREKIVLVSQSEK